MTHQVVALLKRFSQLDVHGKITLKTKFHELSFLDTTSTCSPLEKVKTKGELKSMKSIKREPSIREGFDAVSYTHLTLPTKA